MVLTFTFASTSSPVGKPGLFHGVGPHLAGLLFQVFAFIFALYPYLFTYPSPLVGRVRESDPPGLNRLNRGDNHCKRGEQRGFLISPGKEENLWRKMAVGRWYDSSNCDINILPCIVWSCWYCVVLHVKV